MLVADHDESVCEHVQRILEPRGYEVSYCVGGKAALEELARRPYALLVTDVAPADPDGMGLLRRARADHPGLSTVVLTARGTVRSAVDAMRCGASDYLERPLEPEALCAAVDGAFARRRLLDDIAVLAEDGGHRLFPEIVSHDPRMQAALDTVDRVAEADSTVLITGETGTGKELVARAIHRLSPRCDERFVAVNCGALTDTLLESELFGHEEGAFTGATRSKAGIFEAADGGTLMLDEIGNITPAFQVKLLRVLETMQYQRVGSVAPRHCNVRILAATHVDLEAAVERDEFRRDLYYRINVVPIHLPPLRERPGDIALLVREFIGRHGARLRPGIRDMDISREALLALGRYSWPGNVRQLEHVVQRALLVAAGSEILHGDLAIPRHEATDAEAPLRFNELLPLKEVKARLVERLERTYLDCVLRRCHGNVRETARHAGASERGIHGKLKRYGLDRRRYK